jgi:hypothetical protein
VLRGVVAIVSVLALADVDPIVITFGQLPVVDLPCDAIDYGKVYRFANSRAGLSAPTYDPVPGLSNRARHIGHQIMLSDDATRVDIIRKKDDRYSKYVGFLVALTARTSQEPSPALRLYSL